MDLIDALRSRRSIKQLEGDVSDADLRELIELATWAPNHRMTEPWRFTILRGAARDRFGALGAEILGRDSNLTGEAREIALRREAGKALRAPVIVAVSTRTDADPVIAEEDFAATAAAVQNMLLAAPARGYGAMWRTGDLAHRSETKAFLGLDPSDRIVAFVYVGKPVDSAPAPRPREVEGVIRRLD
jgi:nitroreductase